MFIIVCRNQYGTTYLENWARSDRSRWTDLKSKARRYETQDAAMQDMPAAIADLSGPARETYQVVKL